MRSASGSRENGRENRSDYSKDSRGRSEGASPRRDDPRGHSKESGSHVSGEVIGTNPEQPNGQIENDGEIKVDGGEEGAN